MTQPIERRCFICKHPYRYGPAMRLPDVTEPLGPFAPCFAYRSPLGWIDDVHLRACDRKARGVPEANA